MMRIKYTKLYRGESNKGIFESGNLSLSTPTFCDKIEGRTTIELQTRIFNFTIPCIYICFYILLSCAGNKQTPGEKKPSTVNTNTVSGSEHPPQTNPPEESQDVQPVVLEEKSNEPYGPNEYVGNENMESNNGKFLEEIEKPESERSEIRNQENEDIKEQPTIEPSNKDIVSQPNKVEATSSETRKPNSEDQDNLLADNTQVIEKYINPLAEGGLQTQPSLPEDEGDISSKLPKENGLPVKMDYKSEESTNSSIPVGHMKNKTKDLKIVIDTYAPDLNNFPTEQTEISQTSQKDRKSDTGNDRESTNSNPLESYSNGSTIRRNYENIQYLDGIEKYLETIGETFNSIKIRIDVRDRTFKKGAPQNTLYPDYDQSSKDMIYLDIPTEDIFNEQEMKNWKYAGDDEKLEINVCTPTHKGGKIIFQWRWNKAKDRFSLRRCISLKKFVMSRNKPFEG